MTALRPGNDRRAFAGIAVLPTTGCLFVAGLSRIDTRNPFERNNCAAGQIIPGRLRRAERSANGCDLGGVLSSKGVKKFYNAVVIQGIEIEFRLIISGFYAVGTTLAERLLQRVHSASGMAIARGAAGNSALLIDAWNRARGF